MTAENQLRETISKAISGIPECLAAGYVDIQSGLILEIKTVDSHPRAVIDLLAAATADLFQGQNVLAIEEIFKRARGVDNAGRYFNSAVTKSQLD